MATPNPGVIKVDLEAQLTGKGGRDSSRKLLPMYFTEAEEREMEIPESWKGDTCAILASNLKASLFSATVATFIIQSYQLSSPDSGDAAIALLTQVSQQLINISHEKNVMAQSNASFKSTASATRVNALWCLSLVVSLTCVLSATRTLVQQRARGYMGHARMNAYIPSPTKRFGMSRAVEKMITLLHISVFLFFAGLVDFLFPVNKTVAFCVLSYIAAFAFRTTPPSSGFTWPISRIIVHGVLVLIGRRVKKLVLQVFGVVMEPGPSARRRLRQAIDHANITSPYNERDDFSLDVKPVTENTTVDVFQSNILAADLIRIDLTRARTCRGMMWRNFRDGHSKAANAEAPDLPVVLRARSGDDDPCGWTGAGIVDRFFLYIATISRIVDTERGDIVVARNAIQNFRQSVPRGQQAPIYFDHGRERAFLYPYTVILRCDFSNCYPYGRSGQRVYALLKTCGQGTLLLTEELYGNGLRPHCPRSWTLLLWLFSAPQTVMIRLSLDDAIDLADIEVDTSIASKFRQMCSPEMMGRIEAKQDLAARVVGRCFALLVVKKLSGDVNWHMDEGVGGSGAELVCLSAIVGTTSRMMITTSCLKCRVAIDTNGMLAVTVTVPLSRLPVAGPTNTASYQSFQDNHVLVAGSASINDNESEYSYPGGDSTDDSNQDAQIDNDEVAYHFMRSILRTAQRDTARDATATIEEQLPIVQ
ncbi:hypothetical protein BJV78DRAFT_1155453 [Lactifluus subvellereus]|nr:hypothetical protein BJV78DRAFT_1155453 [Lactifluus subvellereus]